MTGAFLVLGAALTAAEPNVGHDVLFDGFDATKGVEVWEWGTFKGVRFAPSESGTLWADFAPVKTAPQGPWTLYLDARNNRRDAVKFEIVLRFADGRTSSAIYLRGGAVRNCIIADNVSRDQTEDSSLHGKPNWYGKFETDTDGAKNCCWFGSTATGIDSTNADPEFVAPDEGDWRVRTQSPIRNLGLPLEWMTAESVDFAGNPRMRGKHVTPGCYDSGKIGLVIFFR